jgi:uncharacterized membrane protein HdeD (DUF308 family)
MKEILVYLNDLGILTFLKEVIAMCFIALGYVYLCGKMLMIVPDSVSSSRKSRKEDRVKNIIATVVLNILVFIYLKEFRKDITTELHFIYSFLLHTGFSYVIYTILCFRFFDRADSWLDKKGLKD